MREHECVTEGYPLASPSRIVDEGTEKSLSLHTCLLRQGHSRMNRSDPKSPAPSEAKSFAALYSDVVHGYLIATAFGGDPTAPGSFSGTELRKKLYRRSAAQATDNSSKSHNSPIGIPK